MSDAMVLLCLAIWALCGVFALALCIVAARADRKASRELARRRAEQYATARLRPRTGHVCASPRRPPRV